MKRIAKLIIATCTLGFLTGCDSQDNESEKAKEVEIHFPSSLLGKKVECIVDDRSLFKRKLVKQHPVHTNPSHIEKALVSDPLFNLNIIVDGYSCSYDLNTNRGKYIIFEVQFPDGEDIPYAVMLFQTADSPAYE